ncbi:hypothetical protein HIM_02678 [Hirsutella minnesotensis 3608]|nr:hypothetical protein HIM_02678 [Hirsutella minnesotensis 3608]
MRHKVCFSQTAAALLLAAPTVLTRPVLKVDHFAASAQASLILALDQDGTGGESFRFDVIVEPAQDACGPSSIKINDRFLEGDANGVGGGIVSYPGTPQVKAAWTFRCLEFNGGPFAQALDLTVQQVRGNEVAQAGLSLTIVFRQIYPASIIDIRRSKSRKAPTVPKPHLPHHKDGPKRQKVLAGDQFEWNRKQEASLPESREQLGDHLSKLSRLTEQSDELHFRIKAEGDAVAEFLLDKPSELGGNERTCTSIDCERQEATQETQHIHDKGLSEAQHVDGLLRPSYDYDAPASHWSSQGHDSQPKATESAANNSNGSIGTLEKLRDPGWISRLHPFRPRQRQSGDVPVRSHPAPHKARADKYCTKLLINIALGAFVLSYACLWFTRHVKRRAACPPSPAPARGTSSAGAGPRLLSPEPTIRAPRGGQGSKAGRLIRGLTRSWGHDNTDAGPVRPAPEDETRSVARDEATTTTMEEEIAQLREVATMIDGMVTAEGGRARRSTSSAASAPPTSSPRRPRQPSMSSVEDEDSLPPYDTDDESGNPSLVVDGFRYIPGSTSNPSVQRSGADSGDFTKR